MKLERVFSRWLMFLRQPNWLQFPLEHHRNRFNFAFKIRAPQDPNRWSPKDVDITQEKQLQAGSAGSRLSILWTENRLRFNSRIWHQQMGLLSPLTPALKICTIPAPGVHLIFECRRCGKLIAIFLQIKPELNLSRSNSRRLANNGAPSLFLAPLFS